MASHIRVVIILCLMTISLIVLMLTFYTSNVEKYTPDIDIHKSLSSASNKAFAPAPSDPPNALPVAKDWLVATMLSFKDTTRRTIIRGTWQRLFQDKVPSMTTRFVVSRIDPNWKEIIALENKTYGDIIELPHIAETREIANSIKTVEFFKYLAYNQSTQYPFVTKIDSDSFVDANAFYKKYLKPNIQLHGTPQAPIVSTNLSRSAIGVNMEGNYPFPYPSGQMYTLTWDFMKLIAKLHRKNPLSMDEDGLIGQLPTDANETYNVIDVTYREFFEFNEAEVIEEGSAYAQLNGSAMARFRHALAPGAMCPHYMKNDETYLKVAACFDSNGLKPPPELKKKEKHVKAEKSPPTDLKKSGKHDKAVKSLPVATDPKKPKDHDKND